MRIALDAMGTDLAPEPEVLGALDALKHLEGDIEIVLVGDESVVRPVVAKHGPIPERLSFHHAPDRVTAEDPPASVVRKKPDSSIVVGLKLHQQGVVDAFVSAGSTGAMMAGSLFILRPLPGVARPAVATLLPTIGSPVLLIDAGANVDCKAQHLVQFAHLGSTYLRQTMALPKPRVALLNIGEEPGKGSEVIAETYDLLAKEPGLHFVGNVEGRDIIRDTCDVLVCDGFVGNVLLKFYESVAAVIVGMLKKKLAGRDEGSLFEDVFRVLDYSEHGGAPLLGVGGVSIICHGGSTPKAIRNALGMAARSVRGDMVKHSAQDVSAGAR
ncbi:MAG: phosphate acyltransferase PlsX [Longimicrobiales bacterium]